MACPSFEDLLRDGADGHAQRCEECRALLEAWADADATLEANLAGIVAPASLAPAVRTRVARELPLRAPSIVPEILDFMGWAAVLAVAAILVPRYLPDLIRAVAAQIG
jgi:hypothetical protein